MIRYIPVSQKCRKYVTQNQWNMAFVHSRCYLSLLASCLTPQWYQHPWHPLLLLQGKSTADPEGGDWGGLWVLLKPSLTHSLPHGKLDISVPAWSPLTRTCFNFSSFGLNLFSWCTTKTSLTLLRMNCQDYPWLLEDCTLLSSPEWLGLETSTKQKGQVWAQPAVWQRTWQDGALVLSSQLTGRHCLRWMRIPQGSQAYGAQGSRRPAQVSSKVQASIPES